MTHDQLGELERVTAMRAMNGALQITAASSRALEEHHDTCPACSEHRKCDGLHRLLVGELEAYRLLVRAITNYRAEFVD